MEINGSRKARGVGDIGCSASSGIFILLLWWGRAGKHLQYVLDTSAGPTFLLKKNNLLAGDCLYVGIGAISKSTTQQQSGVLALEYCSQSLEKDILCRYTYMSHIRISCYRITSCTDRDIS